MDSASPRASLLLPIFLSALTLASTAQQPSIPSAPATTTSPSAAPTQPTPLQAQGEQALVFILKHVVLDPNATVPGTGKPLTNRGIWSVGKQRPGICPQDSTPCVSILYRVPESQVACQWVVLLQPNGAGSILEQNPDSIHYLLRNIPTAEAAPYVVTRQPPPEGVRMPRTPGTVEVGVIVSTTGDPAQVFPISGPDALRPIALGLSRQWTFRPLTVGNHTVPYQITLKFHFGGPTVKTEP